MPKLLIVDDDVAICRTLDLHFSEDRFTVRSAGNLETARKIVRNWAPEVIVLDFMLPDGTGLELLKELAATPDAPPVILMTGHQEMQHAVEAMKAGAFDFIHKPVDVDQLDDLVARAARQMQAAAGRDIVPEVGETRIVGTSRAILELHKRIGTAARSRVTVLIQGESGTGKELVARAIHHYSAPDAPFVAINCSAIVPTLMESELFGHERGAFTGAVDRRVGHLEAAASGTLFLDEIGDLGLDLQSKLLRVLQERSFTRVGGRGAEVPFRARVIAATHRDVRKMVASGGFRADLFYRLGAFEILIPPLRERRDDISPLVHQLLTRLSAELHLNVRRVREEDIQRLMEYDWPGNVRELENILIQSLLRSASDVMNLQFEPEGTLGGRDGGTPPELMTLADVERRHIVYVLEQVGGRLGEACGVLGITRPTLRKKMAVYGLTRRMRA